MVTGFTDTVAPKYYGMHVHENGVEDDDCATTGGHYNPFDLDHSNNRTNSIRYICYYVKPLCL